MANDLTKDEIFSKLRRGGGRGLSDYYRSRWASRQLLRQGVREDAYAVHGIDGLTTHWPTRAYETHSKSKACKEAFCGACYEKAKGRNYR